MTPRRREAARRLLVVARLLAAGARRDEGTTAIEYCLAASLIALAIFVGASAIGTSLSSIFTSLAQWL